MNQELFQEAIRLARLISIAKNHAQKGAAVRRWCDAIKKALAS